MRLSGKKAFITGGGQGIGEAVARLFADSGAVVSISDINLDNASKVAESINVGRSAPVAWAIQLDVADDQAWQGALERSASRMEGMSVLINNAGIGSNETIDRISIESWRRIMSVNVESILFGTQASLPYLQREKSASIVNMCSTAALTGNADTVAYNASKAAALSLTKSTALHCARKKMPVRCNAVLPTWVSTAIISPLLNVLGEKADSFFRQRIPLGRLGEVNEIAQAVLFLASDESSYITGSELKVDGGRHAG